MNILLDETGDLRIWALVVGVLCAISAIGILLLVLLGIAFSPLGGPP